MNKKDTDNSAVLKLLRQYNKYNDGDQGTDVLKELFENYRYDQNCELNKRFKMIIPAKDLKLSLIKEKEGKSNSVVNFNIVDNFIDVALTDSKYNITPIHFICVFLTRKLANANIQNNEGEIPIKVLFYTTPSCELFKHKLLQLILKKHIDINNSNNEGDMGLIVALDLIENCEAVNIIINKSEIALFLTCKHCYSMMVEALVLKCDDVNIADNSFENKNSIFGRTADVNVVDNEGNISLMFVIQYGTLPIIKAFIEHKAKLDAKKTKNGQIILGCYNPYKHLNFELSSFILTISDHNGNIHRNAIGDYLTIDISNKQDESKIISIVDNL
ncbi:hypothetical protein U3516DRAFT_783737 [Neocallimastix sp. 'constans']